MAKPTSTLNWQTIDPATLSVPIQKQYARYKDAYREMKAERDAFETALRAEAPAPAGMKLAIGYNFGKLSVAVAPDDGKSATTSKPALSFSAFLATQATLGKRT